MKGKITWPDCKALLIKAQNAKPAYTEKTDWQSRVMRSVKQSEVAAPLLDTDRSLLAFTYRISFASIFFCVLVHSYIVLQFPFDMAESSAAQLSQLAPEYSAEVLLLEQEL